MKNLIKYQLRDKLAETSIFILAILIINFVLLLKINSVGAELIMFISSMLIGGGGIVIFISNVLLFSKDLTEDTGYLIYSTPSSTSKILLSKLIVSFVQMAIVEIIAVSMFFMIATNIDQKFMTIEAMLKSTFIPFIIIQSIFAIIIYISTLLMVYLSISFSNIVCKGKKLTAIFSIILFLVINYIFYKLMIGVMTLFPKSVLVNYDGIRLIIDNHLNLVQGGIHGVSFNPVGMLYIIIFAIAMFIAISYLLKNKVDLK